MHTKLKVGEKIRLIQRFRELQPSQAFWQGDCASGLEKQGKG